MKRAHVIYCGTVQGVGFRFTAERIARQFLITGFVKNLLDGSVEVLGEGTKKELESFLEAINERMSGYITSSNIKWESAEDSFSSFDIEF